MKNPTLHKMIRNLFGVYTIHGINPLTETVDIAVTRILQMNPARLGFIFVNLSLNDIYISPDNTVSATRGIYIAPSGGSFSVIWDKDFELCSMNWYATAAIDASAVYVLEIIAQ